MWMPTNGRYRGTANEKTPGPRGENRFFFLNKKKVAKSKTERERYLKAKKQINIKLNTYEWSFKVVSSGPFTFHM